MINLEPISIDGLDCIINSYISIINHDIGNYHYIFWDSWAFYYDESAPSVGESVYYSMRSYGHYLMANYGIEVHDISIADYEVMMEIIRSNIKQGIPVVIKLDTYYCNWYEDFGKEHGEHSFIVVDCTQEGMMIVDTMPKRVGVYIDCERVRIGILKAETITYKANSEKKTLMEFLEHTVDRKIKKQEIEKLRLFAERLERSDLESEMMFDKYMWNVPIIRNIRKVYGSRKMFLSMLGYLATEEDREIVAYIQEIMSPVIADWAAVLNRLQKYHVARKCIKLEKLFTSVHNAAEAEADIMEKVKRIVEHKSLAGLSSKKGNSFFTMLPVEYRECSHLIFSENFTRLTDIFDENLWQNNCFGHYLFELINREMNCTKCEGQCIPVGKTGISYIHFIGYAVWDNQIADCTLEYDDDVQEVELRLSDWCGGSKFGEQVLWTGRFTEIQYNTDYDGCIYDIVIPVRQESYLKNVILPECDKMICMAIITEEIK